MRGAAILLLLALGCASGRAREEPPPSARRGVYDAPPGAAHSIQIAIDDRAAREVLATLSRGRFEPSDAKVLEDLPGIRMAIEDSGRPAEAFERDLAAAFDETTRTAVFEFRAIRQARGRWEALLDAVSSRREDLARSASRRAAALLPSDHAVTARVQVYLSFGLAGLADHLVSQKPGGREWVIVDLARALGDSEGEPLESQLARVARLIAGETYRDAWTSYRETSANWKQPDPQLGELDPLLRAVAEAGPISLFAVDENFFPLSVWLKEPMRRSLEDLNHRAERFAQSQANLEQRVELTAEIRRPEFRRRIAGPAGAFLAEAIAETLGLDTLRGALEKGPRAFFEAYDRAAQSNHALTPLSKVIRDRLPKG